MEQNPVFLEGYITSRSSVESDSASSGTASDDEDVVFAILQLVEKSGASRKG